MSATIGQITNSVTSLSALVEEVSEATRQQASGLEQVRQSVVQMEHVTQTTAATAEESAAASEELNALAATATQMVNELESLIGGGASARPATRLAEDTARPARRLAPLGAPLAPAFAEARNRIPPITRST